MSKVKKLTQKRLFLPVFCMILVLCINMIYDLSIGHNFYNFFEITMTNGMLNGRIINILNRGSEVAILAIGMTLVVSASAGTDISVGSVMSLCASFCCMLVAGFGVSSVSSAEEFAMPLAVGLIGALLMGCLCGAFNGGLVAYLNIQPMVATLILWSAARAIGLLLCNNLIVYIRVPEYGVFGGYVGPIPTPIIIAAVCVAVTSVVLKKTAMGMYVQSVGINKKAARLNGLIAKGNTRATLIIGEHCWHKMKEFDWRKFLNDNGKVVYPGEPINAERLASILKRKCGGIEARATVIGYTQRGAQATAQDSAFAFEAGHLAVQLLNRGITNQAIGIRHGRVFNMPFADALMMKKHFDRETYELINSL